MMRTTTQAQVYNPFSVAPMLDLTTRHCRHFYRQLSQHALLYTEMVTTGAILHGRGHYLDCSCTQSPVALQLGGNVPEELALCAKKAVQHGYVEINLNVGCPSNRVQNGFFGACLMAKPQTVAACVQAMQDASGLPVSVKTRIGIDYQDSYEFLTTFVDALDSVGCTKLIVHARKAWLTGLSPKQNRDIPPLDYSRVYQLKRDFPHLHITINGGIKTLQEARVHLRHADGVMLGREVYQNPYLLSQVDRWVFAKKTPAVSRVDVVKKMLPYIEQQCQQGVYLTHITRHMLGLFQGQLGARRWRRYLSEHATQPGAGVDTVLTALEFVAHP